MDTHISQDTETHVQRSGLWTATLESIGVHAASLSGDNAKFSETSMRTLTCGR